MRKTFTRVAVVTSLALTLAVLAVAAPPKSPLVADAASVCDSCAEWNADREPFRVFGNTYYVGVAGLSSVLVTSRDGHVLIDGALPQSAPLIDAHIRALGFRTEDVKLILSSRPGPRRSTRASPRRSDGRARHIARAAQRRTHDQSP